MAVNSKVNVISLAESLRLLGTPEYLVYMSSDAEGNSYHLMDGIAVDNKNKRIILFPHHRGE